MAAPYARVVEDMLKGRDYATQLQALLHESPEAGRLVDQILHAISRSIDTAKAAAAAASEEASEVQSEVTCAGSGGAKRKATGGDKRGACRRRTQQSSIVTKTVKDLEDGHAWRKYGQKEIQNCKHPKAYFRCTHKYDQQCAAQRQVQRCGEDPEAYRVTYIGVHTCRDPAVAAPLVVHAAGVANDLHAGSRLISFAPNASAATASTTTTGNTSQEADQKDATLMTGLRPLELEGGGDQEEVLSSLTPSGSSAAAEAMRTATATPGPDQGDVTSGLQHCYGTGLFDTPFNSNYDDTFDLDDIVVFGFDQGLAGY
ncbi:hypothetical protein BS78_04G210200 [Paspalum vaginatum]|nr:hypothetical protein BS78_04G210200 [Paspalum vaginatum]